MCARARIVYSKYEKRRGRYNFRINAGAFFHCQSLTKSRKRRCYELATLAVCHCYTQTFTQPPARTFTSGTLIRKNAASVPGGREIRIPGGCRLVHASNAVFQVAC